MELDNLQQKKTKQKVYTYVLILPQEQILK